jgi:hypothetical protein
MQTSRYGAIMETMREKWTDERLDDLKEEVATLRIEIRDEFRAVREEIGSLRTEMTNEFGGIRGEIGGLRGEMHAGFQALNRTMIQFGGLLIAALIGLIATQL